MRRGFFFGRLVALTVCAALPAGCQTFGGGTAMITSSVTAELTPQAASSIAGDLTEHLADEVGPGTSMIQLRADGSAFGKALEASLRGGGYAVATDQSVKSGDVVPLAYSIDGFEGSVLARLSTPELELTRIYRPGPAGATPASPVSIMNRTSKAPQ